MTPVYLSPGPSSSSFPLVELKEDQHLQLVLSPPYHHHLASATTTTSTSTTASTSSSFNAALDPRASVLLGGPKQHHDQYPKGFQYYGRSSGDHHHDEHPLSSSSFQPAAVIDTGIDHINHKFSPSERSSEDNKEQYCEGDCGGDGSSGRWMPSKMRLMQKMMSSSGSSTTTDDKPMKFTLKFQDQRYHVNEISTSSSSNYNSVTTPAIRVCSDCNTTTTPLWRSGPRGPKSLCNACGIRQRKARRAAAAAAAAAAENGTVMTVEASSSSKANNHKLQAHKEKKPRSSSNNIGQPKKSCNKPPENPAHDQQSHKKLCFKKIALSLSNNSAFQGVFSRDVEEAAILLMELSCGFIPLVD